MEKGGAPSVRKGRWKRRLLRVLAVTFLLIAGFVAYYKIVTHMPVPEVADKSAWEWERQKISDSLWTVQGNWLRKSETGLWEIYLEGTPFERGAAYGNLAQELLYEQEVAFVGQLKKMVPDEKYIRFLKYFIGWFNRNLEHHIPKEYKLEIYGESFFGPDSFSFIAPNYPRMLNYHAAHDIGHALVNANLVGCTSFAIKDSQSTDGGLLLGRNFDFNLGEDFAQHKMVVMVHPDSGYDHLFVSWPGFLGVVSGMNAEGLTITLNAAPTGLPGSAKTPISILAREILQYASNFEEAIAIAGTRKTFVSELIMIGSAKDGAAMIIEKTPSKTYYYKQENERITCTNHFLSEEMRDSKKNEEQYEKTSTLPRFERINQLLDSAGKVDPVKAAAILRDQKGVDDADIGMGNENAMNQLYAHHGVIFQPSEKKIWISCNPHQLGKFVCYDLDEVFSRADSVKITGMEIYDSAASIAEDPFMYSLSYERYNQFVQVRDALMMRLKRNTGEEFSDTELEAFIGLNPKFYLGYALAGEYLKMKQDCTGAGKYFEKALTLDIPLNTERKKIEKYLQQCSE